MFDAKNRLAVIGVLDPVSQAASAVTTSAIDARGFFKVVFILNTGVLGTDATVDLVIKGDAASGGSYATTLKTITQIVKATGDNKQVVVEVNSDELGQNNVRYLKATLTVGTAASIVSLVALGVDARYSPGTKNDLASVVQIL